MNFGEVEGNRKVLYREQSEALGSAEGVNGPTLIWTAIVLVKQCQSLVMPDIPGTQSRRGLAAVRDPCTHPSTTIHEVLKEVGIDLEADADGHFHRKPYQVTPIPKPVESHE